MDPRRWLSPAVLLLVVACQAPTSPTPTPTAPTVGPVTPPGAPPAAAAVTPPAVSAGRVEALNAANAAFASGKLKDAAALYERVVNTPADASESELAGRAITDFARFRGMVTLLADGREDEARAYLAALQQQDPAAPLARLADQLYNQYGMVGQLRGACAQLQPQVATQAGPALATLQALGLTNVDATNLCSAPQA